MKRGSSIAAPHVVQIAMGCDGQPILPFLREELEGKPKYRRHIERAGRSGPRCGVAEPGARRPQTERGNLKAPEVTQLNYRLTTKLHKEKVCNAQGSPAQCEAGVGNVGNIEKSHRALVALGLAISVQTKSEGSRTSRLTASPAVTGCAPIGNCNTVARWPSHRRVSSTTCPSGNSSAS